MIEENDKQSAYCRTLGHRLTFKYCRLAGDGLPCSKIRDCWFEIFPVQDFLQNNYTENEIARISIPSRSRLEIMLDTVNRIKRSTR